MKILVVGGGGREHAICWKLAKSKKVSQVLVAPGNAGTTKEAKVSNVAIKATQLDELVEFAIKTKIDFTIIGPEVPLAMGISDLFASNGLACFGVDKNASQFESSKLFTKKFLQKHNIPSADFVSFTDYAKATEYCKNTPLPLVIKADGLAEGKGVTVAQNLDEALEALENIMQKRIFGNAGDCVVIEQCLVGHETSAIAIVDGVDFVPFVSVQDHKPLLNNDKGPNTGGMGVFSPAKTMTSAMEDKINSTILAPMLVAMKEDNITYQGFIFLGLMLVDNEPQVLEINCRLGDPETQAILLRMESDFADLVYAALNSNLANYPISWHQEIAISVVMAAANYPSSPKKGDIIHGLDQEQEDGIKIFHAGTSTNANNEVVVAGGRVLNVSAIGADANVARTKVYEAVERLKWTGCQYRTDI